MAAHLITINTNPILLINKANREEVMDTDEIFKYLKDNLEIYIEQTTEFGPVECVKVTLELEGVEISSHSCALPN